MNRSFKMFVKGDDGEIGYKDYHPEYVVAGDTDSCYIDLSPVADGKSEEEITKFADQIGEITNDAFTEYMKDVFNVSSERAQVIETDREVVSDKSIFLAKKMYVMHVVNNEGLAVDKMKMMGVAIKKTDTPKVVQDLLTDLVGMLMDKVSYEEVRDFIRDFESRYKRMSFQEIGRPMNIKNLNKYVESFMETGSIKGFPYHVRASMYYNSMRSNSDVEIRSGDKIKIVYINHPEMNYIAVPADAEVLPDFIDELDVDWDKQLEKVWKKIDTFLTPIGYDVKSRQIDLVNSLVTF